MLDRRRIRRTTDPFYLTPGLRGRARGPERDLAVAGGRPATRKPSPAWRSPTRSWSARAMSCALRASRPGMPPESCSAREWPKPSGRAPAASARPRRGATWPRAGTPSACRTRGLRALAARGGDPRRGRRPRRRPGRAGRRPRGRRAAARPSAGRRARGARRRARLSLGRRRAGGRLGRRRRRERVGLTARELEVLRLVAKGETNRSIGQALYISEKTVSVHISRILAKLDARGRVEAAGLALRLGLLRRGGRGNSRGLVLSAAARPRRHRRRRHGRLAGGAAGSACRRR